MSYYDVLYRFYEAAISGDFFKEEFPKADVVAMGNILHDWNEESKIKLIQKAYDAFLKKIEERELKYLGKIAKNRKVIVKLKSLNEIKIRIDELAKSLP